MGSGCLIPTATVLRLLPISLPAVPLARCITMLSPIRAACTPLQRCTTQSSRHLRPSTALPIQSHAWANRLLTTVALRHVTVSSGRQLPQSLSGELYKGPRELASSSSLSRQITSPTLQTRAYSSASNMASIKVGDTIPSGTFTYIAYTPELEDHSACGIRKPLPRSPDTRDRLDLTIALALTPHIPR